MPARRLIAGIARSYQRFTEKVLAMHDLSSEMKSSYPKISIGLVVYNGVEHIRSALDSIARQSYRSIELIVVDGGSTDGTKNVLSEYADHISVLVSEPDKGIYDAMNKVCSLATGDWLIFLGCDDVLLDTLKNMPELMINPDAVYYGDVIVSSSGKIYGGVFSNYRLMRQNICHQALFYPRSVYKKYSYSLNYKWLADYVYNLQLLGDAIPFVYTGVVVSIFNDKGMSSQGDADFSRDQIKLMRATFGNTPVLIEALRRRKLVWVDKIVSAIRAMFKCLLPYSLRKYFQSLWRGMRKIF